MPPSPGAASAQVDQNYLRAETYAAANGPPIAAQADIGLAQAWGEGLVAAVDGIRFVAPVRSADVDVLVELEPHRSGQLKQRGCFLWT